MNPLPRLSIMQRDNASLLVEMIERGICGGLLEKRERFWREDLFEERTAPVYPHTPVGTAPATCDADVTLEDGELDTGLGEECQLQRANIDMRRSLHA